MRTRKGLVRKKGSPGPSRPETIVATLAADTVTECYRGGMGSVCFPLPSLIRR